MYKQRFLIPATLLLVFTSQSYATEASLPKVPKNEEALIFKAAGYKQIKSAWVGQCDTGQITVYKDLNGDGLKDAVITTQSMECHGRTGIGYEIVHQQKQGVWKEIFSNSGIPTFLDTKGKDGWLDIENGGAGFCFAVYRWNGKEYDVNHYQYEGKSCDPL